MTAVLNSDEVSIAFEGDNIVLKNASNCLNYKLVTDRFINLVLNAEANVMSILGKESLLGYEQTKTATNADVELLRASTDAKIADIRDSGNMVIPSGSKVYYVSSVNGNDNNDGTSPSKSWKSLSKLASSSIAAGSYVLLERGSLWRNEGFAAKSGVTYTAYGTGAKPTIYGSPENGADPSKWVKTDVKNVWKYTGLQSEYTKGSKWDVGALIFNDGEKLGQKAVREWKDGKYYDFISGKMFDNGYKNLDTDLQFYCDNQKLGSGYIPTNALYLYSEQNPGERFNSIEFNINRSAINITGNNIVIDNICIKYTGSHAICSSGSNNTKVTNCEIGWIGGCIQSGYSEMVGRNYDTRFGNGIEIYGGCDGFTAENNYVYQCYDTGITVQFNISMAGDASRIVNQKNITYLNNVLENNFYQIEYFLSGTPESNPSLIENFLIEATICGMPPGTLQYERST